MAFAGGNSPGGASGLGRSSSTVVAISCGRGWCVGRTGVGSRVIRNSLGQAAKFLDLESTRMAHACVVFHEYALVGGVSKHELGAADSRIGTAHGLLCELLENLSRAILHGSPREMVPWRAPVDPGVEGARATDRSGGKRSSI